MVRRPGRSAKGFDYPSLFDGWGELDEAGAPEGIDAEASADVSAFTVPVLETQPLAAEIVDEPRGSPDALPAPGAPRIAERIPRLEAAAATQPDGMEPCLPSTASLPPDWREREHALDVSRSWIVEAPAGSGKTGLLIQRCLKLLAAEDVTRPEQVLAITFTRLATEEIRERLMEALRGAAVEGEVSTEFDRVTRSLAQAVLRRDQALGWGLLGDPRRLNVRTIDSVCEEIARSLPLLSGGGGGLRPTEDAGRWYREAARRTLLAMGGADQYLTRAIESLLLHRDGGLKDCERLLADMLATRDQWGDLVPLQRFQLADEELEQKVRPQLNRALELVVCSGLTELAERIPAGLLERLSELASELGDRPSYTEGPSPIAVCRDLRTPPAAAAEHLEHWRALIHLIVSPSQGSWRKGFAKNHIGFEADARDRARLKELTAEFTDRTDLLEALCAVGDLPPAIYPDEQWRVAKAMFRVLSRALAELELVFAEAGACDFVRPALLARSALRQQSGAEDFETATGLELRHLLVDEMQDTSTNQYELIELLTRGWQADGRTVFLVGDPKQSIYLFRQARVERFVRTVRSARMGDLRLGVLQLTANFRSQAGLVQSFNQDFRKLFPERGGAAHPEQIEFVEAASVREETETGRVWHAETIGGPREQQSHDRRLASKNSAAEIKRVVRRWTDRPLPPGRTTPWSVAVLVRSRGDLREVIAAFRSDAGGGPVPFRAVDIDPLKERREVLDLIALTRALLHPADRVAWLAILRAPWCGMGVAELHLLAGADDPEWADRCVADLVRERRGLLAPEAQGRLDRIWPVLEAAIAANGRCPLAETVERAWRSLGGDAPLTGEELTNALRYLRLLAEVETEGGGVVDAERLDDRMDRLFAEASAEPGTVELMTIHGAKGLEWDAVIVPETDRRSPDPKQRLLTWEEMSGDDPAAARVMLAPIAGRGEEAKSLNRWLNGLASAREEAERKRLLYVACTRAREELHLFGTAVRRKEGGVRAECGSLLHATWPAAEQHFRDTATVVTMPQRIERAPKDMGFAIAASAEEVAEVPERLATVDRLPPAFDARKRFRRKARLSVAKAAEPTAEERVERPEGSFAARSFGNAVHAFLELMTERLAAGATAGVTVQHLLAETDAWGSRIAAVLRGDGLAPAVVDRLATQVRVALRNTLTDPVGRWIVGPHPDAHAEWTLSHADGERSGVVRMDRVFRAGAEIRSEGDECLWIVDYKTATHGAEGADAFLDREREKYRAQMQGYARVAGDGQPVRVGLWYPMLARLVV